MNVYARFFDQDVLAHDIDELLDFLSGISEVRITKELVDDIVRYVEGDIVYPKRYKIRPRVYFILIKTMADSLEEFKNNQNTVFQSTDKGGEADEKEIRLSELTFEREGWYKGSLQFKRVIMVPDTGKFQYEDTVFTALTKSRSGLDCYNSIIKYLKGRPDVDPRSQFPSAKGDRFHFVFVSPISEGPLLNGGEMQDPQDFMVQE